jgi:hypothetical protein
VVIERKDFPLPANLVELDTVDAREVCDLGALVGSRFDDAVGDGEVFVLVHLTSDFTFVETFLSNTLIALNEFRCTSPSELRRAVFVVAAVDHSMLVE